MLRSKKLSVITMLSLKRAGSETAPKIRQIYNRVVDFFDTLRGMVTGNQSARQIFQGCSKVEIFITRKATIWE